MRALQSPFLPSLLAVSVLAAACATNNPRPTTPSVATVDMASSGASTAPPAPRAAEVARPAAAPTGDLGPLPVTASDPISGRVDALVTIVAFGDFQCPFCARSAATLGEVRRKYSPSDVRIVWKNNPLPFHQRALPAAEVGMAIFESKGPEAFWQFHDAAFADQRALEDGDLLRLAADAGVSGAELSRLLQRGEATQKVTTDMALARAVGAMGTPAFFINGASLSGAQPLEKFVALIDTELARAKTMAASGTPRESLYATLSKANFATVLQERQRAREEIRPGVPEDTTPMVVSIGGSPVLGPANALVTIVEFSEFQCPFCARVQPALTELMKRHPGKIRLVWKNQPLPFHPRAEPMAQAAMEAFAQRGNDGFWKVHNALWKSNPATTPFVPGAGASAPMPQPKWDDAELVRIASQAGAQGGRVQAAITGHKHKALIDADMAAATKLGANGTPTFFINGRRLVGAQPIEAFEAMVIEEIGKAQALVGQGVPAASVYDTLQRTAKAP